MPTARPTGVPSTAGSPRRSRSSRGVKSHTRARNSSRGEREVRFLMAYSLMAPIKKKRRDLAVLGRFMAAQLVIRMPLCATYNLRA